MRNLVASLVELILRCGSIVSVVIHLMIIHVASFIFFFLQKYILYLHSESFVRMLWSDAIAAPHSYQFVPDMMIQAGALNDIDAKRERHRWSKANKNTGDKNLANRMREKKTLAENLKSSVKRTTRITFVWLKP